jgi:hypothetical protein
LFMYLLKYVVPILLFTIEFSKTELQNFIARYELNSLFNRHDEWYYLTVFLNKSRRLPIAAKVESAERDQTKPTSVSYKLDIKIEKIFNVHFILFFIFYFIDLIK